MSRSLSCAKGGFKRKSVLFFTIFTLGGVQAITAQHLFNEGMYFATVSDTEHFPWLQGLIESIQKYNHGKINQIAIFDLGLTQSERDILCTIPFVKIYDIEPVNDQIKEKFVVRPSGRRARGWYTWKPIVLHQALQMFPYVLYLDSGIEVVAPLDKIFIEIKEKGYYLFDCGHLIFPMVTQRLRDVFKLDTSEHAWILEEDGISAGMQGISRELFDSYIIPVYKLASDIKNFEDDGTAPWGFGGARHDQAIFSILARKLGLKTHKLYCRPSSIRVGNSEIYFGVLKHFSLRKHNEKDTGRLMHAKKHQLL